MNQPLHSHLGTANGLSTWECQTCGQFMEENQQEEFGGHLEGFSGRSFSNKLGPFPPSRLLMPQKELTPEDTWEMRWSTDPIATVTKGQAWADTRGAWQWAWASPAGGNCWAPRPGSSVVLCRYHRAPFLKQFSAGPSAKVFIKSQIKQTCRERLTCHTRTLVPQQRCEHSGVSSG